MATRLPKASADKAVAISPVNLPESMDKSLLDEPLLDKPLLDMLAR
jgi:hypothetical protein